MKVRLAGWMEHYIYCKHRESNTTLAVSPLKGKKMKNTIIYLTGYKKWNGGKFNSHRYRAFLHPEDGPSQQEDVNSVRSGRKQR